jgi:hypothetical protein
MSSPENIWKKREERLAEQARLKAEEEARMSLEIIEVMQNLWHLRNDERFNWTDEEVKEQAKDHKKRLAFLREHLPGHKKFKIPVSGSMTIHLKGSVVVNARTKEEADLIARQACDVYMGEIEGDVGYSDRWHEYVFDYINKENPSPSGVVELEIELDSSARGETTS